jgi:hypothetical protein
LILAIRGTVRVWSILQPHIAGVSPSLPLIFSESERVDLFVFPTGFIVLCSEVLLLLRKLPVRVPFGSRWHVHVATVTA